MRKNLLIALLALTPLASNAQVTLLKANKGLEGGFVQLNGKAFLTSSIDSTLWVTDGSPGGTIQLSSTIKVKDNGALLNGHFIFVGSTPATGWEVYISDGTVAGTQLLKDIYTGPSGSDPDDYALFNGQIYFSAKNADYGRELWKTDGTDAGTTIVKDIIPGPDSSNAAGKYNLFSNGSYLLFAALKPGNGVELFKSDGTAGGTDILLDINPGADSSNADDFTSYNNMVLFVATTAANGRELWKTDGTPGGTQIVKDIWDGTESGVRSLFVVPLNGKLLFTANNGINGDEPWTTDGTLGNTNMVKDINAGSTGSNAFLFLSVKYGNKIIFTASDSTSTPFPGFSLPANPELWESDGTEAGTKLFKEIVNGKEGSSPIILASIDFSSGGFNTPLFQGSKFFFIATTPDEGTELWISDGTSSGTHLVKDINPNQNSGITNASYIFTSNALYFAADDGVHGNEVWKSDGTSDGTLMVADINPNADPTHSDSDMELPFFLGDKILFSATSANGAVSNFYRLDGAFSPLPLKFGDFTVAPKNADALLQWSTVTEVNTKSFSVQRSYDGAHFTEIGTVSAAGTSSNKRTYNYTDRGVMNSGKETVYYRIVTTDKDGKTVDSKIIALRLKGGQWSVKIVSNLVRTDLDLVLTGITQNIKVSIKDIAGKTVGINLSTSANGHITLAVGSLMPGMYLMVAESNDERRVLKFVKQ